MSQKKKSTKSPLKEKKAKQASLNPFSTTSFRQRLSWVDKKTREVILVHQVVGRLSRPAGYMRKPAFYIYIYKSYLYYTHISYITNS